MHGKASQGVNVSINQHAVASRKSNLEFPNRNNVAGLLRTELSGVFQTLETALSEQPERYIHLLLTEMNAFCLFGLLCEEYRDVADDAAARFFDLHLHAYTQGRIPVGWEGDLASGKLLLQ
jgi:hypothetical protein